MITLDEIFINFKDEFDISKNIKKIIFNEPATIVLWKDGTKTVSKCLPEDTYDKKVGLALCILKKVFKNRIEINKIINKYTYMTSADATQKKGKIINIDDIDFIHNDVVVLVNEERTQYIQIKDVVYIETSFASNRNVDFWLIVTTDMREFHILKNQRNAVTLNEIYKRVWR